MPATRYRCTACGNLTRFDVTTTRRSRAFHHYTVGGALAVEDEEVLSEVVEDVSCRWCGSGKDVQVVLGTVVLGTDDADEGDGASAVGDGRERPR